MSDWIGPNVYRIAGYADRKSAVTVKDGNKNENAEVVVRANETNQGDHWQFVHVGTGVSKKEEFVIINRYTGIVAAQNNAMMLVTHGEGLADDSKIQIWKGKPESKGTWWYLELIDGMALQSADIGKAAEP
ncbi:agglutinin ssa-like protein [Stemphylium lycopersici]|nr:agglutinin ssa-like protein [Stemphylium lycopersici]